MMVGHTKFDPDWCFGLLKRRLQWERVSCLKDLIAVVEVSGEVNSAELVGREDGTRYVCMGQYTAGRPSSLLISG